MRCQFIAETRRASVTSVELQTNPTTVRYLDFSVFGSDCMCGGNAVRVGVGVVARVNGWTSKQTDKQTYSQCLVRVVSAPMPLFLLSSMVLR